MKINLILIGACVALASCGPLNGGNVPLGLVASVIPTELGNDSPVEQPAPRLTRAFVESQPTDLLRVSIIAREATALVIPAGTNGTKTTWFSEDGLSVTFDQGVLIGTRGLGDDLMGANVSGTISSLRTGGNYLKTMQFLDGLDQIETQTFECIAVPIRTETITIIERDQAATVTEETCSGSEQLFKNTYWTGPDGVVWQARQWVSPDVGYLGYQRL